MIESRCDSVDGTCIRFAYKPRYIYPSSSEKAGLTVQTMALVITHLLRLISPHPPKNSLKTQSLKPSALPVPAFLSYINSLTQNPSPFPHPTPTNKKAKTIHQDLAHSRTWQNNSRHLSSPKVPLCLISAYGPGTTLVL